MDDGWVSVGTSWVGVAASVVLLDGLVLEVDTVLEVLVEDEVDEDEDEDEDVSLEVVEEDVVLVPVPEAVPEVSVTDGGPVVTGRLAVALSEGVVRGVETVADDLSVPTETEVPSAPMAGRMDKIVSSGMRFLIMRLRVAWSREE